MSALLLSILPNRTSDPDTIIRCFKTALYRLRCVHGHVGPYNYLYTSEGGNLLSHISVFGKIDESKIIYLGRSYIWIDRMTIMLEVTPVKLLVYSLFAELPVFR